jgi:hypothetical protein
MANASGQTLWSTTAQKTQKQPENSATNDEAPIFHGRVSPSAKCILAAKFVQVVAPFLPGEVVDLRREGVLFCIGVVALALFTLLLRTEQHKKLGSAYCGGALSCGSFKLPPLPTSENKYYFE